MLCTRHSSLKKHAPQKQAHRKGVSHTLKIPLDQGILSVHVTGQLACKHSSSTGYR